jgi:hypothetical protein
MELQRREGFKIIQSLDWKHYGKIVSERQRIDRLIHKSMPTQRSQVWRDEFTPALERLQSLGLHTFDARDWSSYLRWHYTIKSVVAETKKTAEQLISEWRESQFNTQKYDNRAEEYPDKSQEEMDKEEVKESKKRRDKQYEKIAFYRRAKWQLRQELGYPWSQWRKYGRWVNWFPDMFERYDCERERYYDDPEDQDHGYRAQVCGPNPWLDKYRTITFYYIPRTSKSQPKDPRVIQALDAGLSFYTERQWNELWEEQEKAIIKTEKAPNPDVSLSCVNDTVTRSALRKVTLFNAGVNKKIFLLPAEQISLKRTLLLMRGGK